MTGSEKICLKWNDFQETISSSFKDLRQDKDFADVTLACEDGHQVAAHKVVLTSFSPLFMNILKSNKHQHPLVYMRGIKSEDLVAIIDFLYLGETRVLQENLDSFLAIANELRLKGLTGELENPATNDNDHNIKRESLYQETQQFRRAKLPNTDDVKLSFQTDKILSLDKSTVSDDSRQLDEQISSMMEATENFLTRKSGQRMKAFVCKVCGKEAEFTDLKRHIESFHISGTTHSCEICGKISRSRRGLRRHNDREHSN